MKYNCTGMTKEPKSLWTNESIKNTMDKLVCANTVLYTIIINKKIMHAIEDCRNK